MTYVVDTNVFIYFFDGKSSFHDYAVEVFKAAEAGTLQLFASELVWTELLSKPMDDLAAQEVLGAVSSLPVDFKPLSMGVLLAAAKIRRNYRTTLADALHVALAEVMAEPFMTNDQQLLKKPMTGISTVRLADALRD